MQYSTSSKVYDVIVRVSKLNGRPEDSESTMTVKDQLALCEGAIAEQGGKVGQVFKAMDQSGFTAVTSKPYQRAKARVAAGETTGLAVAYDDRLARNWRKVGRFYDELEEVGAEVLIAGMPGVDYRTANGRMMTGLMAVVADAQYQTYKARGDRTIRRMLERGVPNAVPYGYRRNGGKDGKADPDLDAKALVPDPDTAPVVALIFAMRSRGAKWSEVMAELHARGASSPSGGEHWVTGTLNAIIANRTYLGHVVFAGQVVVRDAHQPLVDPKTFNATQSTVPVVRTGKQKAGIAGGLLVCASCGLPLSVGRSGSTGTTFYACRRTSVGLKCPKPVHIDQVRVDEHVDGLLRDVASGKSGFDLVKAHRALAQAKARLASAQEDFEQFQLGTSGMRAERIAKGMRALEDAIEAAQADYDSLLAQVDDHTSFPTSASAWDQLAPEDQRLAAKAVLDHITVAPFTGTAKAHSDVESRLALTWR